MISIILMEPMTAGNVGAIARSMSNFDFVDLIVINPRCDILSKEAQDRAKHAKDILKKAKIADKKVLDEFDYLIGTTARFGTDYNILRSPLTPKELAQKLDEISAVSSKEKIGILFGREGDGLYNDEIAKCDFTVTIPVSKKYSSMNLSHAATIIFYALSEDKERIIKSRFRPINSKDKEILEHNINEVLDGMSFPTAEKKETQVKLWKRLIGKSMLTKREAQSLFGFLKKIKEKDNKK